MKFKLTIVPRGEAFDNAEEEFIRGSFIRQALISAANSLTSEDLIDCTDRGDIHVNGRRVGRWSVEPDEDED